MANKIFLKIFIKWQMENGNDDENRDEGDDDENHHRDDETMK